MENAIKKLLRELYEGLDLEEESKKSKFNIFSVLGVENKEVIVCRFLGSILDPWGTHGLGAYPLWLFIKHVLGNKEFTEEEASRSEVVLEDYITGDRRVDIVIYTESCKYPIEAKIWAGDQDAQLNDYYRYFFGNDGGKQIFYLTPEGREPSRASKSDLSSNNIKCLSFFKDIKPWLEDIIKDCTFDDANVKSSIKQFIDIICEMENNNMNLNSIEKALGLCDGISYTDELRAAVALLQHSEDIYRKIRVNFLRNKLKIGDNHCLRDCTDEDKKKDPHALLKVTRGKDNEERTIAWICVEKNLYIVCEKVKSCSKLGWKESYDTYSWKHIRPEGYSKKTYNMTDNWDISSIDESTIIDISSCLEEIDLS